MHLQLDPVGGISGDMFVAALIDAFPQHEAALIAAVEAVAPVRCRLVGHNDGVLQGRRFLVEPQDGAEHRHPRHDHARDDHGHAHGDDHPKGRDHQASHVHSGHSHDSHVHWSAIRNDLRASGLAPAVRESAVAIFSHLAEAEAAVHGIAVEAVEFHEVGAFDSIADIVAAAFLVDALGGEAVTWSVGPLPLGSGRVMTAHGLLPVPAPATALLLAGFPTLDDGVAGERVTPTGAAILRHLCAAQIAGETASAAPRCLGRSGIGFGTRRLPGLSNCLRVLTFEEIEHGVDGQATAGTPHRELLVIEFEVDDQSAEDLAMGLDRLRAHGDVLDVVQMPVFGKKGRMMTHVRALARASAQDEVVAACFGETTTIGLRHHLVSGSALPRRTLAVEVDGRPVRVKCVDRPGGRTAKAEADDVAHLADATHAARAELRRAAERLALESDGRA